MAGRRDEETLHPVFLHIHLICRGRMAGLHPEHIADRHACKPGMRMLRNVLRKIVYDRIVEGDPAVALQKPDGKRGKTLADGKHPVKLSRPKRSIIAFEGKFSIACQQKRVHRNLVLLQFFDHSQHGGRWNTGFLRRAACK